MKKCMLQKQWTYASLSEVKVINGMAPLMIETAADAEVLLQGMLMCDEDEQDFEFEDYLEASFSDGVLTVDLQEISSSKKGLQASQLKLSVPANVLLSIHTENFPLSFMGLQNTLKIVSENSPVSIKNCEGDIHIDSENGPVKFHHTSGNILARMENGPISAEDICGDSIKVESENGPIRLRLANFKDVDLESENGPIHYETQPIEGGNLRFKTENGIVHLVLPLSFSFTLTAESESGRLKSKLDTAVTQENNTFKIENLFEGDAPTIIRIETENGLIKLSSDGHINLDFIKTKLEQLKDALSKANTSEEKEKVKELLSKVTNYLSTAARYISEENIKSKVNEAIEKMKAVAAEFDLQETKTTVISKIEELGSEIYDGINEGLRNVKAEFDGLKYEHLNSDALKEYINKVVNSPLIKPYLGAEKKRQEGAELAERSRLKILDMLEAGKISSEEAERLLTAIGKD